VIGTTVPSAWAQVVLTADVAGDTIQIIPGRDSLATLFALHSSIRTILIFMSQPLALAQLDDGATVTLDVGRMNALFWHMILPFDQFPAFGIRTLKPLVRAFLCSMTLDVTSWNNFIAILIRTLGLDFVAHVDDEAGCLAGIRKNKGSTGRALIAVAALSAVSVLFQARLAKGVVAFEDDWIDERDVADGAHQVRVVALDIFERP
jgi:hypothetical protein